MQSSSSPFKVKKLHEAAKLPMRGSAHAIGADLCCVEAFTLQPLERKLISTGLAIEIHEGYYGRIAPRSGLAVKHGIDTLAGVIDSDYRGEIRVLLINFSEEIVRFTAGERIAQLIIEKAETVNYEWAEELSNTARGAGGFGSSGQL
jgi:dUTP pyrophosphatase